MAKKSSQKRTEEGSPTSSTSPASTTSPTSMASTTSTPSPSHSGLSYRPPRTTPKPTRPSQVDMNNPQAVLDLDESEIMNTFPFKYLKKPKERTEEEKKLPPPFYAALFFGVIVWISLAHVFSKIVIPRIESAFLKIADGNGPAHDPMIAGLNKVFSFLSVPSIPYAPLQQLPSSSNPPSSLMKTTVSNPLSSLAHPKVEIDSLRGISPIKEYNDLVLSAFPQEASQGRIPCQLPAETPVPMTVPQIPSFPFGTSLKFAMVADLDRNSRDPVELLWHSYIKTGTLEVSRSGTDDHFSLSVAWEKTTRVSTNLAAGNRSIELSDIVWFNEKFLTVCDYTGVVYTIRPIAGDIFPRFILADGDGRSSRTFKSEWMTTQHNQLYIGSHGKEWIQDGVVKARGAEWVKVIDVAGGVASVDWGERYQKLRAAVNATSPGYLTHEAVLWHEPIQKWIFLPRKHSDGIPFDDLVDETQGTNLMLIVDDEWKHIEVRRVGPLEPEWGFASIARVPGTSLMLATKVKEIGEVTESKVTVFDLEGNILLDPPFVEAGDLKFEGVEFVGDYESL